MMIWKTQPRLLILVTMMISLIGCTPPEKSGQDISVRITNTNISSQTSKQEPIRNNVFTPTKEIELLFTPEPLKTSTKIPIPQATETPIPTIEINKMTDDESRFYKPDFYKTFIVKVGDSDLEIPLTIGMTKGLTERPMEPIKSFDVKNHEPLKLVAESFMKSCWLKYNKDNGTTYKYEDYLKLVKAGSGQINMYINNEAKSTKEKEFSDVKVDPKKGVIVVFDTSDLVVLVDNYRYYSGLNKKGQLILVNNAQDYQLYSSLSVWEAKNNPVTRWSNCKSGWFIIKTLEAFGGIIVDLDKEFVAGRLAGKVVRQFSFSKSTQDVVSIGMIEKIFTEKTLNPLWLKITQ